MTEKPEHGMSKVRRPTPAQWEEGPIYVLRRADFRHHDWYWHGFNYAVEFRGGSAEVYGPHFEQWIGDTRAAKLRIEVTKPKTKAKVKRKSRAKPKGKK